MMSYGMMSRLLAEELQTIKKSMVKVNEIFRLMPEKCDPYIYYHRVRPYIFGWKNNPDLPEGLIYDGFFKINHNYLEVKQVHRVLLFLHSMHCLMFVMKKTNYEIILMK